MLRALGLNFRSESVSFRAWADRLASPLMLMGTAAVLARVQPLPGVAPFALALLAAGLFLQLHPAWLLAGCLTGSLGAGAGAVCCPVGAAVTLAASGAARLAGQWLQRRHGRASPGETALCMAAALGVLASGAIPAADGARQSLQVVGAAALAAAGAPLLRAALGIRRGRRWLMPAERAGLQLLLGAAVAGLAAAWMPLGSTAAYLSVLIASPLGAGACACTGIAAGAALMFSGGGPVRVAMLGVCGLLGGAAARQSLRRSGEGRAGDEKRISAGVPWTATVFLAVGTPLFAAVMHLSQSESLCALAACAAGLAMPGRWQACLRMWLGGDARGACDPDRLARQLRAETAQKLRALSEVFGELSEGYRGPVDVPDEQTLICEMRAHLCEGCSRYPVCWAGDDNRAVRFLCQLVSGAIEWSGGDRVQPLFPAEMPPDILRQCARGRSIPSRLGILLEEFADKRRSELKRGAIHQLLSAQFLQAQMLLRGMANVQERPMRVRGKLAARAQAALDRAGIAADVMALRGARRVEIIATLESGLWTPELAGEASAQLGAVFGREYAPDGAAGTSEMKFVRRPVLRMETAACSLPRSDGSTSGDSHLIRTLDGDRLLMMISDGMGSGEEAAKESAQTLRLLSRFLAADVSRSLALETVNELMLARTDSDMFATVDLCVVDLASGMAEFTKLSACRSLVLRKEEITIIEGGRLPLGILERVQPSVTRVRIRPGDIILMASDGVMDAIPIDELCDLLEQHAHSAPDHIARTILDLARLRSLHPDDLTLLVGSADSQ